MSKTLHPEDGIVISKKWLEEELKKVVELSPNNSIGVKDGMLLMQSFMNTILYHSQPLKPVLEVAHDTAAGKWNRFPDVLPAVGSECVVITKNGTTYTSIFKDGLYWTSVKKPYDVEYWALINKPK